MLQILTRRFASMKSFISLEQMNKYLGDNKHPMTVVYFRAAWNPNCAQSDKEAEKLAAENAHLDVIRIDSDAAPKIAKHYSVRCEPEFVFCLFGDEVIRQIGPSYSKLQQKNEKMVQLSNDPCLSGVTDKWRPYGHNYQAFYHRQIKHEYEANVSDL